MTKAHRDEVCMVYTPNSHIPIGEAIRRPDGSLALRVKNHRTRTVDEISLDSLCREVVMTATNAETRTAQGFA